MDTPAYDIVFSGTLLAGCDPGQARAGLARLFKTDAAGIERLFCGQPVIIKRGVDRQTADKYRTVLEKVGAMCEIRVRASADGKVDPAARMTVAPAGELLTTFDPVAPPAFDLCHLSLAEAGVDILADAGSQVASPLYDLTAFSLAPPGSVLVAAGRPEPAPLPDIGALSMAEPGSVLDTRGPTAAVVLPDISNMNLAPAGTAVKCQEEVTSRPVVPGTSGHRLPLGADRGSAR